MFVDAGLFDEAPAQAFLADLEAPQGVQDRVIVRTHFSNIFVVISRQRRSRHGAASWSVD